MDTTSQPASLLLPLADAQQPIAALPAPILPSSLAHPMLHELWLLAEAESLALTPAEFDQALAAVGTKLNHGLPPGSTPDPAQCAAFFRALHLREFALAQACALGHEAAWHHFFALYRASLTQAAIAITGSATLGHDLADSLYSELFGLTQRDGGRRSPLASYSGRGSLIGWLRATLAQRHVDHHRRSSRESPLEELDPPAPQPSALPDQAPALTQAVARALRALVAEDRFLLASYFLDRQTLLQIARLLHVHEATISRRLKRLTADLRNQLLHNLRSAGLSQRAAEEALGTDPRDLEINLRALLQTSQTSAFSVQTAPAANTDAEPPAQ